MANENIIKIRTEMDISEVKESLSDLQKLIESAMKSCSSSTNLLSSSFSDFWGNTMKISQAFQQSNSFLKEFQGCEGAALLQTSALAGELGVTDIILGLLSGSISVATTMQTLWNAAMAANPIGAAIVAVGLLAAGIAFLCANQEREKTSEELLAESQERLAGAYVGVAQAAQEYYEQIANGKDLTEGMNEGIFFSKEDRERITEELTGVQEEISEIARAGAETRGFLNDEEMGRLGELFEEMKRLSDEELAISQSKQEAALAMAEAFTETFTGSAEEYALAAQDYIATAEATRATVVEKAKEQYLEETTLINEKYKAMGDMDSEQRKKEMEAAEERYQTNLANANAECADTIGVVQQGYSDRATALQGYMDTNRSLEEQERLANQQHSQNMIGMQKDLVKANAESFGAMSIDQASAQRAIDQENKRHTDEMTRLNDEQTKSLNEKAQKESGIYLAMGGNMELYGGKVSEKTNELTDNIVAAYGHLEGDAKDAMYKAMEGMLQGMKDKEEGLYIKAGEIAENITSKIKKALDINSPSRKTRRIFHSVIEGAQVGLEDKEPGLYTQAKQIVERTIGSFSAAALFAKMRATVGTEAGRTSKSIAAFEGQRSSLFALQSKAPEPKESNRGTAEVHLNIDGREFAVITAPYLSKELAYQAAY